MRYGTQTNLTSEEVLDRARDFFGSKSELGLPEVSVETGSLTFATETGGVSVTTTTIDGTTDVEILSREYDFWAERFLRELH